MGVAVAYSVGCFLVQLPICYYMAGRSGCIRTRELWQHLLIHLPLGLVVFAATWSVQRAIENRSSPFQLLICLPAGFVVGATVIACYPPSRRVALSSISALWEWRRSRTGASIV